MDPSPPERLRFQFSRQDDLASDIIAFVGAGDFSHVDIVLEDGRLLGARSDELNGVPAGVQIRAADYARWSRQVIIAVPCTGLQKAVALDFAMKQVGKPYDKIAIGAFVVGRNWRDDDAWFCSELGASVGEHGGVWPALYSPSNKIMPVPLALVCSAIAGRQITVLK